MGYAEEITIFDELQRQLQAQVANISFPLYTSARLLLRRAEGKSIDASAMKQSFANNPGLALITDILEEVTGISFIHLAINVISVTKPIKEYINKNREYYKKCISHMQNMQADEIKKNLAYYFSADVNECNHTPIYIFFDTYEAYTSDPSKDEWLHGEKGLIRNMGDTVFVIAGQVKLKWQQHDIWRQHVESHLVQNLSPNDSIQFLLSCSVEDEHLREKIFQLTKGSPLWLDLCVAQYYNLYSHGMTPDIETIGHEKKGLVERHLYYIPKYLHDVYHLLAAMRCWTEDLTNYILRGLNVSVSPTEYNDILHQPYIDYSEESQLFTMSDEIATILSSRLAANLRKKTIELIMQYLQNSMPAIPNDNTSCCEGELQQKENRFEIAWKALLNLVEDQFLTKEIIDVLMKYADYQQKRFCYSKAEAYLTQAVDLYQKLMSENAEPIRFAKSRLAEALYRAGKADEAIQINEALLKTCDASTDTNHDYMSVKNNLANYYMSIGKKMDTALLLREEVLLFCLSEYGEDNEDTWHAQNNMACIYMAFKRYEEATSIFKDLYEKYKTTLGENHRSTIGKELNLGNAYTVLSSHGHPEYISKAGELLYDALKRSQYLPYNYYMRTLSIKGSIAKYEEKFGSLETADKFWKEVVDGKRDKLGESHIDTIEAIYDYSQVLFAEKKEEQYANEMKTLAKYRDLLVQLDNRRSRPILKWLNSPQKNNYTAGKTVINLS